MTMRHECRNCKWSVLTFGDKVRCSNVRSGRTNVDIRDWCGKWEHENTEAEDDGKGISARN